MALVVKDRVKQFSTTTGTGTITLGATPTGFQAFSVIGDGSTTYYAIVDNSTGDWEVGLGTYTLSGTTLARTTVLESSNAGSLVNFAAGTKEVFVTYPADKAVYEQASGLVELPIQGLSVGDYTFIRALSSGGPSQDASVFRNNWSSANTIIVDGDAGQLSIFGGNLSFNPTQMGLAGSAISSLSGIQVNSSGVSIGSSFSETAATKSLNFYTNRNPGSITNLLESDNFGNFNLDSKTGSVVLKTDGTSQLSVSTVQFTAALPWRGQNGTVSAPALSASADTNTGVYFPAADTVAITTGGVERLRIEADGDVVNKGVFYYNARTITASITLSATDNAMSIGPITINNPAVVTVPDGGNWAIL